MKKIIAVLLAAILCLSLCSCGEKSPEQKLAEAREATERARQNAEDAEKRYNDLMQDIKDYEDALAELEKYK